MSRAKLRLFVTTALVLATLPAWAFDWGGSTAFSGSTTLTTDDVGSGSATGENTSKLWALWQFGKGTNLLLRANVTQSLNLGFGAGFPLSYSATPELDSLVFSTEGFLIGRTTYRDFTGVLLNAQLDGVQFSIDSPGFGSRLFVATSAGILKTSSTIVVSQADLTDRLVDPVYNKVETLFAPPRVIAYAETEFREFLVDQSLQLSLLGQYDLRQGQSTDGGKHDPTNTKEPGATVSTVYSGLGGEGRIAGPVYWGAWAYAGFGRSLTPTGTYVKARTTPTPVPAQYQTWKTSYVVNGIAKAELSLLLPEVNYSIAQISVNAGSWDPDGISPDLNLANGSEPTLYTGYFGVSRTGQSLVFAPQPANMVTTALLYSTKPLTSLGGAAATLQTVFAAFIFARPTTGSISEAGLKTGDDLYLGAEGDFNLLWRPASDWGINAGVGVFFPNTAALARRTELSAQLSTNLSF